MRQAVLSRRLGQWRPNQKNDHLWRSLPGLAGCLALPEALRALPQKVPRSAAGLAAPLVPWSPRSYRWQWLHSELSLLLLMGMVPVQVFATAADNVESSLSADNSLSTLSLSAGTLSPSFQYNVTDYTASVGADVASVEGLAAFGSIDILHKKCLKS